MYSHNTGLPEHSQSGFLSQANYLLPWDVHVRVTSQTASWAASEKTRSRKKQQPPSQDLDGQVFVLKIFVGCEYECTRGHRFIMNSPDKVLRGGAAITRDSGSKIVFNDMPLYFPCPCRTHNPKVAQMMRVHIVTPKAPVNISIDPKVIQTYPWFTRHIVRIKFPKRKLLNCYHKKFSCIGLEILYVHHNVNQDLKKVRHRNEFNFILSFRSEPAIKKRITFLPPVKINRRNLRRAHIGFWGCLIFIKAMMVHCVPRLRSQLPMLCCTGAYYRGCMEYRNLVYSRKSYIDSTIFMLNFIYEILQNKNLISS